MSSKIHWKYRGASHSKGEGAETTASAGSPDTSECSISPHFGRLTMKGDGEILAEGFAAFKADMSVPRSSSCCQKCSRMIYPEHFVVLMAELLGLASAGWGPSPSHLHYQMIKCLSGCISQVCHPMTISPGHETHASSTTQDFQSPISH